MSFCNTSILPCRILYAVCVCVSVCVGVCFSVNLMFRYSQFRDEYSLEQIMQSRMIHEPMTMLQCW